MASIRQRGENSWLLTVMAGKDANGKYIRRFKTVTVDDPALLKTKKRLQDYLDAEYVKFREEVESGEYIKPEKMTFGAFIEEWRQKYAVKHLAFKSLAAYDAQLKTRLIPEFGGMKLEDIKPLNIVNYLDKLEREKKVKGTGGLSSSTIDMNRRILMNIFNRAVEWRIIKNSPVVTIKKPKVSHQEFHPFDEHEVHRMLRAAQSEPYHWRMMITIALMTGMRRGELLGLEWKHIDWKNGIIEVSQTLVHASKGEIIIKEPKTKNGKRKLALSASVLEELREYYAYRAKERDKLGDAWNGKDKLGREWNFVFSNADGTPFHHHSPNQWFRLFLEGNGLRRIRFHDLRHTSATLLISQGVHAKIISERLGHGNITTTMNIYGHALRSADQSAADKLEALIFNPKTAIQQ
ncbi:tyrosine recombinase XerC [Cohnella sp. AR92]|uniref:site-specific integrase n=1 Tax=Cohnella sp. AR92 TaxID=648716 RepID=UPI000F8E9971|nr:site-specific integrase [Cohnella sp. AR92]RUS47669.1 site-specific integrase [Cohnella sp. AR92]